MKSAGVSVVLAVNQVDRIKDKTALLPFLGEVNDGRTFAAVHPVSALKRKGLEPLVDTLLALMPPQPPLYADAELTDKRHPFPPAELAPYAPPRHPRRRGQCGLPRHSCGRRIGAARGNSA